MKKIINENNCSLYKKLSFNYDQKYKKLKKEKYLFDKMVREISKRNHSEALIVPLKSKERTIQKAISDYNGDINKVKDILRASIISEVYGRVEEILADVKKSFHVIRIKDRFKEKHPTNYKDISINVQVGENIAEIQIHVKELLRVNSYISHLFYEITRKIEATSNIEGREIYSWEDYVLRKANQIHKYSNLQAWQRQIARENGQDVNKMLFMVTHDKNKYLQLKSMIPTLKHICIPIQKIQSNNPKKIIKWQIDSVFGCVDSKIVVENLSLYCKGIGNLPGPLLKPFLKNYYKNEEKSSLEHFAKMVINSGNTKARLMALIGFAERPSKIYFFEGSIEGDIVMPRGNGNYDVEYIFQPTGMKKTLAEMDEEEKNKISMVKIAANKLINFLHKKYNMAI